jgi:hypothetical protein
VSHDPAEHNSEPTGEHGPPKDALSRLEERLERASQAADRLIAEAAARAWRKPPAAGWQRPDDEGDGQSSNSRAAGDIETLLGIIQSLRGLIPPDLQRRLAEAVREILLALRALIDWYLERSELRRGESVEVQDIPIL